LHHQEHQAHQEKLESIALGGAKVRAGSIPDLLVILVVNSALKPENESDTENDFPG
jgi:hypothetical protein